MGSRLSRRMRVEHDTGEGGHEDHSLLQMQTNNYSLLRGALTEQRHVEKISSGRHVQKMGGGPSAHNCT